MKRLLAATNIAATLAASSASAFDPADLKKLKGTNECVKCDLTRANLTRANLSYANLCGAELPGANLTSAKLSGAKLEGAILNYAIMDGAIFCNTTMPDGRVIYSGC